MNTVETLALVVAEQARKIAQLEAFIASKMVVAVTVSKPAESVMGSIAAAHPDVPVRDAGRQHAHGTAPTETEAAKARAREAARKAAADEDGDATYHFYDKFVSSKGEISLVWNIANQ